MTTIFEGTAIFHGIRGDRARVAAIEGRVLLRCADTMADEAATVAFTPEQARKLAAALLAEADNAEAIQ